jgi:hypothetical protein
MPLQLHAAQYKNYLLNIFRHRRKDNDYTLYIKWIFPSLNESA